MQAGGRENGDRAVRGGNQQLDFSTSEYHTLGSSLNETVNDLPIDVAGLLANHPETKFVVDNPVHMDTVIRGRNQHS